MLLFLFFQVAINAWTWSTVFHTRDVNVTEVVTFLFHIFFIPFQTGGGGGGGLVV